MNGRKKPTLTAGAGIELILPDWFYSGVFDHALILTLDRSVFRADGRPRALAVPDRRKHGGRQSTAGASTSLISTPSPEVSRPLRLRLRYPRYRSPPAPARLQPDVERTPSGAERLSIKSASVEEIGGGSRDIRGVAAAGDKL